MHIQSKSYCYGVFINSRGIHLCRMFDFVVKMQCQRCHMLSLFVKAEILNVGTTSSIHIVKKCLCLMLLGCKVHFCIMHSSTPVSQMASHLICLCICHFLFELVIIFGDECILESSLSFFDAALIPELLKNLVAVNSLSVQKPKKHVLVHRELL